jgi:periplasmic divalent cation tolerance protein
MSFLLIYVTTKDEKEAHKIANQLLSKRMIACANMFPVKSLYWWKGAIESDDEYAMIMKTQELHKESIISEIKTLHSYDVRCIEFFKIEDGSPDYLEWIMTETTLP